MKQSSYTIKKDLLQELLDLLKEYSVGSEAGNEDVIEVRESLEKEIERQDYMAQAVGLIDENTTA